MVTRIKGRFITNPHSKHSKGHYVYLCQLSRTVKISLYLQANELVCWSHVSGRRHRILGSETKSVKLLLTNKPRELQV